MTVRGRGIIRRHHHRPRRRRLHLLRLSSSFHPGHLQYHHTQILLFKNQKQKNLGILNKSLSQVWANYNQGAVHCLFSQLVVSFSWFYLQTLLRCP